jgi:hypothetical protein
MMPKNTKYLPTKERERPPPVSAFDEIPVAIPIASNGAFLGYRRNPYGLHVTKSNAGRSAAHDEEIIKLDPMISTDLILQDDTTRLTIMTNNGTNNGKRKASSIDMHTTDSEPTTKRPKSKIDRSARSDTEDNPFDDKDRKPVASNTTASPDGVPSTCAGLERKSTSTRTRSVVYTSGQGIKLEQTPKTETAPVSASAPTDPSTDQIEASIPTETRIDGPNLNRASTGTMRRKVAKRSDFWYKKPPPLPQNILASLEESLSCQAEDLAKKYEELYEYRQGKRPFVFLRQDPESFELSKWVFFQRCEYRRMVGGQDSILIPERVKAVDYIGFNSSVPQQSSVKRVSAPMTSASGSKTGAQLGVDFQLSDYSVLCNGGKDSVNHIGNRRLRILASMYVEKYSQADSKAAKSVIVSDIITSIRQVGGNFCKYKKGAWFEVGEHYAREKVSALLRDLLHTQYRSSNKSKVAVRRARNQN